MANASALTDELASLAAHLHAYGPTEAAMRVRALTEISQQVDIELLLDLVANLGATCLREASGHRPQRRVRVTRTQAMRGAIGAA